MPEVSFRGEGLAPPIIAYAVQQAASRGQHDRTFRELLEALPAALYTTDAQGCITFYNAAAVDLWGREPVLGDDKWCGSWRLFWPDGRAMAHDECPMAIALKENRPVRGAEAVAERPDGSRVPFIPYPTPLRDDSGTLVGGINMLVDISERKDAEVRQQTLIAELNHRVKNTLATVQSIAVQTLRGAGVPRMVSDAFEARLFALSRTHDQLTREQWQSADLKQLAEDLFAPYRMIGRDRVRLSGRSIALPPRVALTLALVLNELATNAAKYGALSTDDGVLDLSWDVTGVDGEQRLRILWRESGGPPVTPPARRGFGSRFLEKSVRDELNGSTEIAFDPDGVRCAIEVPLATDSE